MRSEAGWDESEPFTLQSNPLAIVGFPPSAAPRQAIRNLRAEEQAIPLAVSSVSVRPIPEPRVVENRVENSVENRVLERVSEYRADEHGVVQKLPELPAASRDDARRSPVWLYTVAGLVVIAGVTGAIVWAAKKQPQPVRVEKVAPRVRLGFSATLESPVWKLSWDRAAMDELNPVGAVLSIEDGGIQQQVPLAPADLASGTIFYTPQSDDLSFSLRVDRGGGPVEEHVRVLGVPRTAPKPVGRVPQSAPAVGAVPTAAKSQVAILPGKQPPAVTTSTASSAANPGASAKPVPSSALPAIKEASVPAKENVAPTPPSEVKSQPGPSPQPSMVALAVPVAQPAEPPRVNRDSTPTPPPAPITQPAPPPPAAPAPAKSEPVAAIAPSVSPAPAPPPTTVPLPTPQATAPKPSISNYVGPRPLPASAPSDIGQRSCHRLPGAGLGWKSTPAARLTKASPIQWTATNAPLMLLAVRAASSWVFDPAKLNGKTVPSQMTLTFRVNGLPAQ